MKVALRILIFSQIIIAYASGQAINSIGLQSGVALANQTWFFKSPEVYLERGYRTGFYGAATLDFLQWDHFHITSEVGYCEKGFYEYMEIHSGSSIIPIEMETQVSYLFLNNALKLKYETNSWRLFTLMGFRIDKQFSYVTYNDPKDFQEWIYGLTGAVGIEYKFRRAGVYCMGQYLHDLTKFIDTEPTYDAAGTQLTTGMEITNTTYVINLGVRYYLEKD